MFGRKTQGPREPLVIEAPAVDGVQLLLERAMLWRTTRGPAYGVVEAAVQCLVEGHDEPLLCELAGATHETAGNEVYELWPKVVEELGLVDHDLTSRTAEVLAARAYVRNLLAEKKDVQTIVRIISKEFDYDGEDALTELISMEWQAEQDAYAKKSNLKLNQQTAEAINALLAMEIK